MSRARWITGIFVPRNALSLPARRAENVPIARIFAGDAMADKEHISSDALCEGVYKALQDVEEKKTEQKGEELENPDSEASRKKEEADRLRAAEKFMKIGTGEAFCRGCGYEYKPSKGDPEYPVSAGTYFQDLPSDWQCPICGAEKRTFENKAKEIAGFAENQGYGFGTNSMTSGQKSILIYGSLLLFFALFCAGYLLQ